MLQGVVFIEVVWCYAVLLAHDRKVRTVESILAPFALLCVDAVVYPESVCYDVFDYELYVDDFLHPIRPVNAEKIQDLFQDCSSDLFSDEFVEFEDPLILG